MTDRPIAEMEISDAEAERLAVLLLHLLKESHPKAYIAGKATDSDVIVDGRFNIVGIVRRFVREVSVSIVPREGYRD